MKTGFLITGLVLLLVANLLMVYSEGFTAEKLNKMDKKKAEHFSNYYLENAESVKNKPIGAYDNLMITPDNKVSCWRNTLPDEPLLGPIFKPGPDSLFIFKNNQSKPECCSSSYSSDTGCVCTTPQQREFINTRGGNRTVEETI
jgi:hypothetical protein